MFSSKRAASPARIKDAVNDKIGIKAATLMLENCNGNIGKTFPLQKGSATTNDFRCHAFPLTPSISFQRRIGSEQSARDSEDGSTLRTPPDSTINELMSQPSASEPSYQGNDRINLLFEIESR
jgi:hypothetical protein